MSNINWKDRAIFRGKNNKKLKKRIKELIISRDSWKDKAMRQNQEMAKLQKQVSVIKKNIQKIMNV